MQDFDRALRSYSEGRVAPGLERRVLDRVHARRIVRPVWLWVVPALAALLVMGLFLREPKRQPKPGVVGVRIVRPPERVIQPVAVRHRRRTRKRIAPERELIAFLDEHPQQAAHLLWGDEPLTIEPLIIQDLP